MSNIPEPREAPVFSDEVRQPYANRSVMAFIWLGVALLSLVGFTAWYFLPGDTPQEETVVYKDGSYMRVEQNDKSALDRIIGNMFGGADSGLKESAQNFNLGSPGGIGVAASPAGEYARIAPSAGDPTDTTGSTDTTETIDLTDPAFPDILGAYVFNRDGRDIGTVHDVLIDPETVTADRIVINRSGSRRDLAAMAFDQVVSAQGSGADTSVTVPETVLDRQPDFSYEALNMNDGVSVRYLHQGRVLDFDGRMVGEIETVIYEDGKAEDVNFIIAPHLTDRPGQAFSMNFSDFEPVEDARGYALLLGEEQTRSLAAQVLY